MTENPYSADITVRLRDLDPMKHVNNAVYATYLEEARSAYYADVLKTSLEDGNTVIVDLNISYKRPITKDQDVRIDMWVPELGESSLPIKYEICCDGNVVAMADTVQVYVNPETESAASLPTEWRNRISNRHGL